MTVEEAIKGIHTLTDRISLADDRQDAIAMAIKSLEAWEKVVEEIEDLDTNFEFEGFYRCQSEVAKIIDKHLKEVDNG